MGRKAIVPTNVDTGKVTTVWPTMLTKLLRKGGIVMTGVASVFKEKERSALAVHMGVILSDSVDYSFDELESLYDDIVERFPYEFDPVTGEPKELALIFEGIIDKFYDKLIPEAFQQPF